MNGRRMARSNQQVFSEESVVGCYQGRYLLQPPERAILEDYMNVDDFVNILDIGVGAGRTAEYFRGRRCNYCGIDYSRKFIEICVKKFSSEKNMKFLCLDARNLESLGDNKFDLILFSFNGIDYVPSDDRVEIIKEVKSLLSDGGWFVFSSHNLRSIRNWPKAISIYSDAEAIVRRLIVNLINPRATLGDSESAIIRDSGHNYRLLTYYSLPEYEIELLRSMGFSSIKSFSLVAGKEMTTEELIETTDSWIYYMAQAKNG